MTCIARHESMAFSILGACSPATHIQHRALPASIASRLDLWRSPTCMSSSYVHLNHLKRSGCLDCTHTLEGSWAGNLDGHWIFPHHEAAPAYEQSVIHPKLFINCPSYPSMRTSCQSICRGMAPRPWSGVAQVVASSLSIRAQHLKALPPRWVTLRCPSRRTRKAASRLHLMCWRVGCLHMMRMART